MKKFIVGILAFTLLQACATKVKNTTDSMKKYPPFDIQNMDTTVKPGDDFFTYANGNWLKNNPIPADKNSRSAFDELFEKNRHDIREIIEEAAATKDVQAGSNTEKIGTFYNSGMDSLSIEQTGHKPAENVFRQD